MQIDQFLNEKAVVALSDNPYLNRRNLRVETRGGRIRMTGEVSSYYQKQIAQEIVRRIDGVAGIENQLEVNWT